MCVCMSLCVYMSKCAFMCSCALWLNYFIFQPKAKWPERARTTEIDTEPSVVVKVKWIFGRHFGTIVITLDFNAFDRLRVSP